MIDFIAANAAVEPSAPRSFNVVHRNGTILAYCDSREEADEVCRALSNLGRALKHSPDARREFSEVVADIAQGAINVAEGHTVIEPNSRVHRAMTELCELTNRGAIGPV